jgi:hypothetical protein
MSNVVYIKSAEGRNPNTASIYNELDIIHFIVKM